MSKSSERPFNNAVDSAEEFFRPGHISTLVSFALFTFTRKDSYAYKILNENMAKNEIITARSKGDLLSIRGKRIYKLSEAEHQKFLAESLDVPANMALAIENYVENLVTDPPKTKRGKFTESQADEYEEMSINPKAGYWEEIDRTTTITGFLKALLNVGHPIHDYLENKITAEAEDYIVSKPDCATVFSPTNTLILSAHFMKAAQHVLEVRPKPKRVTHEQLKRVTSGGVKFANDIIKNYKEGDMDDKEQEAILLLLDESVAHLGNIRKRLEKLKYPNPQLKSAIEAMEGMCKSYLMAKTAETKPEGQEKSGVVVPQSELERRRAQKIQAEDLNHG